MLLMPRSLLCNRLDPVFPVHHLVLQIREILLHLQLPELLQHLLHLCFLLHR